MYFYELMSSSHVKTWNYRSEINVIQFSHMPSHFLSFSFLHQRTQRATQANPRDRRRASARRPGTRTRPTGGANGEQRRADCHVETTPTTTVAQTKKETPFFRARNFEA